MANEEGFYFDREINEQLRGVSRRASLEIILDGRELSEEKIAELMQRKNDYYVDLLNTISAKDVLPGVEPFLLELNARGIKVALASASKNARPILHRLGLTPLFDAIGDGWSVSRSKPALMCLFTLRVRLASMLMSVLWLKMRKPEWMQRKKPA